MSMSIAPPSAWPPTGDRYASPTALPTPDRGSGIEAAKRPAPVSSPTSPRDVVRNNEIAFDEKSGLTIVRTVDVATGDVVAQNPSEAYLRLAHAMIATLRGGDVEGSGADVLA